MAPTAKKASHQPCANGRQMMQTTRIDIMTVYLIMRERRSASGEGGSVVIECCCFMMVAGLGGAPHLSLRRLGPPDAAYTATSMLGSALPAPPPRPRETESRDDHEPHRAGDRR